jgi:hypothetical protein
MVDASHAEQFPACTCGEALRLVGAGERGDLACVLRVVLTTNCAWKQACEHACLVHTCRDMVQTLELVSLLAALPTCAWKQACEHACLVHTCRDMVQTLELVSLLAALPTWYTRGGGMTGVGKCSAGMLGWLVVINLLSLVTALYCTGVAYHPLEQSEAHMHALAPRLVAGFRGTQLCRIPPAYFVSPTGMLATKQPPLTYT